MSGPKNKGDLVNRLSAPGEFDPKGSRINFSVISIFSTNRTINFLSIKTQFECLVFAGLL
jgi:hypothetical protein